MNIASVLFITFDYRRGAVLSHAYPDGIVSESMFARVSPLLQPKSDLTGHPFSFFEAGSELVYFFCAREIFAEHYERNILRFTLCFVFKLASPGAMGGVAIHNALEPYTSPLVNVAEELCHVEMHSGFISGTTQSSQQQLLQLSTTLPTPQSEAPHFSLAAALTVESSAAFQSTPGSESFSTPFSRGSSTGNLDRSEQRPLSRIICRNAFDAASLDRGVQFTEVIANVYQCLRGEQSEVELAPAYRFSLSLQPPRQLIPRVHPDEVPLRVRCISQKVEKQCDLLALAVYRAVNGTRSVAEVAEVMHLPIAVVIEALQHLILARYIFVIPAVKSDTVLTTTAAFVDVLSDPVGHERDRTMLFRYTMRSTTRGARPQISPQQRQLQQSSDRMSTGSESSSHSPLTDYEAMQAVLISAALSALSSFSFRTCEAVQEVMRVSPWPSAFESWEIKYLHAMVVFALANGWVVVLQ